MIWSQLRPCQSFARELHEKELLRLQAEAETYEFNITAYLFQLSLAVVDPDDPVTKINLEKYL